MIKRKGKVTRIVHVMECGDLRVGDMTAARELTEPVVGSKNVPRSDYKVTYEINGKGNLRCFTLFEGGNTKIENIRTGRNRMVCFLPSYFIGHRLKRTVEVLKKKGVL